MNKPGFNRMTWTAAGLAVMVVCLLATQTQAVRRMFATPTAVATVDIVRCFNALDRRGTLEKGLNDEIDQMNATNEENKKKLDTMTADLQDLAPGSPKYKEQQDKLLEATYAHDANVKYLKMYQEQRSADIILELYADIRDAAARMATSRGIDIVFVDDTKVEMQAGNMDDVTRQISARRMLYVNPQIDITDDLIDAMNRENQQVGPRPRAN